MGLSKLYLDSPSKQIRAVFLNYNTSIGLTFKPDPNYPYIYDPMYPKENFMVQYKTDELVPAYKGSTQDRSYADCSTNTNA